MPDCLTLKKSNCKNCYKCIRHCPVKAIRFSGNQAHIIGNECILCGQCFVVCPQDAKEIVDETEKVRVLLQSGDPVIVSMAPSFIANYDDVGTSLSCGCGFFRSVDASANDERNLDSLFYFADHICRDRICCA